MTRLRQAASHDDAARAVGQAFGFLVNRNIRSKLAASRQPHDEFSPVVTRRFKADVAAVGAEDLAAEAQAQPDADARERLRRPLS